MRGLHGKPLNLSFGSAYQRPVRVSSPTEHQDRSKTLALGIFLDHGVLLDSEPQAGGNVEQRQAPPRALPGRIPQIQQTGRAHGCPRTFPSSVSYPWALDT